MIDRNIRVQFWRPTLRNPNDVDFGSCLDQISRYPDPLAYQMCMSSARLRAERVERTGSAWEGDFVRQQTDNIPPIAREGEPLEINPNPIGHRCAFRYCEDLNVLAMQSARPGVSVSLTNDFIRRRVTGHRGFFFDPCLSSDALERIRSGTPRYVEFRVARPTDLAHVEPEVTGIRDSLTYLQDFLQGHNVDVTVSSDRKDRERPLSLRRIVELFSWASGNREQVNKFKVKIDEESDPLDLLAEQIDKRGIFAFDGDDLDAAFEQRLNFVRLAFEEKNEELESLYGAGE